MYDVNVLLFIVQTDMPNTQSKEKIDLLKWLGAEVHAVPAVPFTDPMNYNHQAKRCAVFFVVVPRVHVC